MSPLLRLIRLFRRERPVIDLRQDRLDLNYGLPGWMVRDLGLDDPQNLKAVERGGCRKPATEFQPRVPKLPGHS